MRRTCGDSEDKNVEGYAENREQKHRHDVLRKQWDLVGLREERRDDSLHEREAEQDVYREVDAVTGIGRHENNEEAGENDGKQRYHQIGDKVFRMAL